MKSSITMNRKGQITFKGGDARRAFEAITGKRLPMATQTPKPDQSASLAVPQPKEGQAIDEQPDASVPLEDCE